MDLTEQCAWCTLPCSSNACAQCTDTHYCDKTCQFKDWFGGSHEKTCKATTTAATNTTEPRPFLYCPTCGASFDHVQETFPSTSVCPNGHKWTNPDEHLDAHMDAPIGMGLDTKSRPEHDFVKKLLTLYEPDAGTDVNLIKAFFRSGPMATVDSRAYTRIRAYLFRLLKHLYDRSAQWYSTWDEPPYLLYKDAVNKEKSEALVLFNRLLLRMAALSHTSAFDEWIGTSSLLSHLVKKK